MNRRDSGINHRNTVGTVLHTVITPRWGCQDRTTGDCMSDCRTACLSDNPQLTQGVMDITSFQDAGKHTHSKTAKRHFL